MRIVEVCAASAVGDGEALERVDLGRGRCGEVVHEPHGIEPGRLGRERAFEDAFERHAELRQIDPQTSVRPRGVTPPKYPGLRSAPGR